MEPQTTSSPNPVEFARRFDCRLMREARGQALQMRPMAAERRRSDVSHGRIQESVQPAYRHALSEPSVRIGWQNGCAGRASKSDVGRPVDHRRKRSPAGHLMLRQSEPAGADACAESHSGFQV